MVLIKDQNLPPLQWHLGRVSEIFPDNDGVVRVEQSIHGTGRGRER
jgi:hypothetical protein